MFRLILLLNFVVLLAKGQEIEPIATDRPDQTECPFIVPVGYFQMENGFVSEHDRKANSRFHEVTFQSSLLKVGIHKRAELRLIVENSRVLFTENSIKTKKIGFNPIQLGFKFGICEEKGIIPKISLIAHSSIPKWASSNKKEQYFAPNFRFTMQHTLTDKMILAYNLGSEWDGETRERTDIYTLTTGFSLHKKVGFYVELYGFLNKNLPQDHRFDGGFTFTPHPNILLDVSGGIGITDIAPDYFTGFGVSFRLPK